MKRAELIIGKTYYLSESANWRDKAYGTESYVKTAQDHARRKVIILETQLKTEHERKYRAREVWVRDNYGRETWVSLNHIRCEWVEAVKAITDDRRGRLGYDDRGVRYARHLARKVEREQYKPAYNQMMEAISELTGKGVYGWDRVESAFTLDQLKTINEALSLLKTQKPALKEVA